MFSDGAESLVHPRVRSPTGPLSNPASKNSSGGCTTPRVRPSHLPLSIAVVTRTEEISHSPPVEEPQIQFLTCSIYISVSVFPATTRANTHSQQMFLHAYHQGYPLLLPWQPVLGAARPPPGSNTLVIFIDYKVSELRGTFYKW